MQTPTTRIALADRGVSEHVDALRLGEYAHAHGFTVQPPGILWNASDDAAAVLVAWDGDEAVATLRAALVTDAAGVERTLECPWDFPYALDLPVVVLGKMATRKAYRKTGLNWALRAAAFEVVAAWGAKHVLGTMVAGSPRQAAMEDLGYAFFDHPLGWGSPFYRSQAPVMVCALDWARHGDHAMARCRALAGAEFDAYPFVGPRTPSPLLAAAR